MASRKLVEQADEVADVLALLGNGKRLAILCHISRQELTVGAIAEKVDLSQSALSQHLAKLRNSGLVRTRRERQMIYYSCLDGPIPALLGALDEILCKSPGWPAK
jgi:DNA-binding transcriptional ArsR family regulator